MYTQFGERVEAQINKLTADGADVSSAQELLAQYKAKVQELDAVPAEDTKLFKQTAHDAKEILRELLHEIKEIRKATEKAAEIEDEAEEKAEDEAPESAKQPVDEQQPAADNGSEVPNVNEPQPTEEQPAAGASAVQ